VSVEDTNPEDAVVVLECRAALVEFGASNCASTAYSDGER
jgi:hypothetical protein